MLYLFGKKRNLCFQMTDLLVDKITTCYKQGSASGTVSPGSRSAGTENFSGHGPDPVLTPGVNCESMNLE